MATFTIVGQNGFGYFQQGSEPRLLIHAGTHGDEYEVIDLVREWIEKYGDRLPDFIYVPEVSPSAVKAKQRSNGAGKDINRSFFEEATEDEVVYNRAIIEKGPFELMVSFHEDPEYQNYYVYDVGFDETPTKLVQAHNLWLLEQGIGLLNGLDDPDDPELGFDFKDGYRRFVKTLKTADDGMIVTYGMNRGYLKQAFLPETPGLAPLQTKRIIVHSFFERVLVPYFSKRKSKVA